jgi:hypothetical protein
MKVIELFTPDKDMFSRIIKTAQSGIWDGGEATAYYESCIWYSQKYECSIVFTKEEGYHSGGWWKNPDYERCYHLSISFRGGRSEKKTNTIIEGIFGPNKNLIWTESAYSKQGKEMEVWHYRLFCDPQWKAIQPRGEVYNTHFTERGWKSFSEKNNIK